MPIFSGIFYFSTTVRTLLYSTTVRTLLIILLSFIDNYYVYNETFLVIDYSMGPPDAEFTPAG